ncbi:SH3 domain-containing protein [Oceanobacillus timonensis]|uniref:SH3 domain-containing protein n=1 Tax=Oceanobacillus timonensis TaxID=1926285 RepID=UPI0009B9A1B2|nr:SH3 domain-containing protein [Oceanobacillus timonensis]
MRKSSKFRLSLLFIAGVVFIAFVLIMQRQFNNPDFDYQNETAAVSSTENDDEAEETDADDETTNASESDEESEDTEEAEDSEEDTNNEDGENHQVTADQLNIYSNPSTDSQVLATLGTNDSVQVIGEQDEYEWIEVAYEDVTGYVNAGYLEPVE